MLANIRQMLANIEQKQVAIRQMLKGQFTEKAAWILKFNPTITSKVCFRDAEEEIAYIQNFSVSYLEQELKSLGLEFPW